MKTYWITKYALSAGVESIDAEPQPWGSNPEQFIKIGYSFLTIGRDCFDNEADAKADAERRREKKVTSLRKQIAKLEKLTF